jgi:tetratricopeptide (TPR) repeat protein
VVALAGILFCCPYVSKVTPLCNTLSAVYLKEGALADIHLTRELLRAVARGDMPPRVLVEFGLQHLTSLCPACREEYLAWKREQSATVDYDSTFRVLPLLVERHQAEVKDKGEGVERDLRTLLRYAHSTRLAKIRRANTRFRGTLLASLLLEESKKQMAGDPQRADELAETAEVVLSRTRESPGVADLSARAAAYRANVYRLRGNPREARKHFDFARYIIRNRGVTDPLVYAEVDSCEAVLDMEQSRFGRAEELLTRAIALYSLGGAREQAAHPLVTLGLMYYHQGDSAKAVEFTQAAVDAISPERDRRLYLSARYNLSLYLCEAGYYHAAAETLLTDRDLYAQFQDPYTQLRLVWLEGKIAAGFEKFEEAEKAFLATRNGFIQQGGGYDAAMVSMDLALLYAKQGRTADLQALAGEMHKIFEAEDVHREAVAALLLFEDAAKKETLTVESIRNLASYLRQARVNPTLRLKK